MQSDKGNNREQVVSVRYPIGLLAAIDAAAEAQHLTRAEMIRRATARGISYSETWPPMEEVAR